MLSVKLYGETVGYLAIDNGKIVFEYDYSYQRNGLEISPFLMPLSQGRYSNRVSNNTFKGLPEFISDALPDRFGNQVINSYYAKKGVSAISINALQRLSYVGKKAIGALEFEPQESYKSNYQVSLQVNKLVQDARSAINGNICKVSSELISIGSSAGGARPKALIGADKGFKNIISGQYDVPEGFEHYLIKFDGVDANSIDCDPQGYSNIEYAYFLMSKEAKVDMMDCYLLGDGDRKHFVTKRFDRVNNEKIHVQTLCALTGIDFNEFQSGSYRDYFASVVNLDLPLSDQEEAFRRMVFNVLAVNRDDHTKNFSFILSKEGRWSLAPAYDVTHAYNERNPNAWTREHNLLINGKGLNIHLGDLLAESAALSLDDTQKLTVIEQVKDAVKQWSVFAYKADVKQAKKEAIEKHINEALIELDSESDSQPETDSNGMEFGL
ncbi:type II toxin-antitoxin system HipA family toxin [Thiomicrorhabdus aquaedulcis]|uniref:type II toxin-antitoxin system HipA family toxin n=1 Tax=Thiomicrorhabdus aquaedulcis TaxID=2211106 RepID=UPI000FDC5E7A|nr:type II toxin-antitoxin system HipA family toxin [Thiomicrorhabdus aquaedulcis]